MLFLCSLARLPFSACLPVSDGAFSLKLCLKARSWCSMKLPAETLLEALMCLSSCCCAHGLFSSLCLYLIQFAGFFHESSAWNSLHLFKEQQTDELSEICLWLVSFITKMRYSTVTWEKRVFAFHRSLSGTAIFNPIKMFLEYQLAH